MINTKYYFENSVQVFTVQSNLHNDIFIKKDKWVEVFSGAMFCLSLVLILWQKYSGE